MGAQTAAMAAAHTPMSVDEALVVLELDPPVTPERIEERYQRLCTAYSPNRAGMLTNHPQQFMKRVVRAEKKRQELDEAYRVLLQWLEPERR